MKKLLLGITLLSSLSPLASANVDVRSFDEVLTKDTIYKCLEKKTITFSATKSNHSCKKLISPNKINVKDIKIETWLQRNTPEVEKAFSQELATESDYTKTFLTLLALNKIKSIFLTNHVGVFSEHRDLSIDSSKSLESQMDVILPLLKYAYLLNSYLDITVDIEDTITNFNNIDYLLNEQFKAEVSKFKDMVRSRVKAGEIPDTRGMLERLLPNDFSGVLNITGQDTENRIGGSFKTVFVVNPDNQLDLNN